MTIFHIHIFMLLQILNYSMKKGKLQKETFILFERWTNVNVHSILYFLGEFTEYFWYLWQGIFIFLKTLVFVWCIPFSVLEEAWQGQGWQSVVQRLPGNSKILIFKKSQPPHLILIRLRKKENSQPPYLILKRQRTRTF